MAVKFDEGILKVNGKLAELQAKRSLEAGIEVANSLLALLGDLELLSADDVIDSCLLKLPNSERQDPWFQQHPWMRGERSAFELLDSSILPIQAKFYWVQKGGKAYVAGAVHFTKNWEDHDFTRTDDFKVGIDFFLTSDATSVLVVLSNRGNLRVLELSEKLTMTQLEILQTWQELKEVSERAQLHNFLWESFRLQSVNAKFYDGISDAFNELMAHLKTSARSEEDAKLFASRLLGRLIFIWFLRKMKLISETNDYFEPAGMDQSDFYRHRLEKLFFGTLNTPVEDRTVLQDGTLDSHTPYLNGGLFAPRENDWVDDSTLTFPAGYFVRLFEHFGNFNFTTDESTPEYEQVAIDPEMLGRVFESLLASQVEATGAMARKAKGAFYTPREVVSFMCRESIRAHLNRIAPDDERLNRAISKLIDTSDQDWAIAGTNSLRDIPSDLRPLIADALNNLKSIDPACGSGAFPLGLLQLLSKIQLRLDPRLDLYKLKLSILQNNIFGADIEPMAVEISRLRSWLSLVVEEANSKIIEPLPNLEFNFVCVNSLIPLESEHLLTDSSLQGKLNEYRQQYFTATSPKKKKELQSKYMELITPDLFDAYDERSKQLKTFNPFDSHQSASFFDAEHMFGHPYFDVVIGNPPYEVLEGVHWKNFAEQVRNIPSFKYSLGGRLNLFRLFIERSWYLLSEGAVLSFIVPSTLIADKNTSGIRKLFKQEGTLDFLIEFPEKEHVFQSVTQATTVFLYRNIKSSQKFKLSVGLSSSALPPLEHAELSWSEVEKMSGESLTLPLIKSPDDLEVIENIKIGSVDLQNLAKCYKGDINLGYFKSQLSDEPASHLLIRGEHIQPYFVNLSTSDVDRRWIALETELPGAAKARIACQNVANMGLKQRINAGFVPEGVIVADSCNCVEPLDSRVDEYFLLGLLNSKLMNWYFKKFSTNNHVNVYELETLPVRVPSTEQLQRLSNLVRQITGDLGPSSLSVGAETSLNNQQVLDEIDAEVYRLYNLAESEIVIVEREF